jgi:hypothetical protein
MEEALRATEVLMQQDEAVDNDGATGRVADTDVTGRVASSRYAIGVILLDGLGLMLGGGSDEAGLTAFGLVITTMMGHQMLGRNDMCE